MTSAWLRQAERGSLFWLKVITWIALRLGRVVARILLVPITLYFVATSPASRSASRSFLKRALGRRVTLADVIRHHHCFASTILDRVYLLSGQTQYFDVQIFHGELLAKRVAAGEGCILLGSHLGSFEVLRVLAVRDMQYPVRVLMDVAHNPMITGLLDSLCPELADTAIPTGGLASLVRVKESLESGYLVGILGDRSDHDKQWQVSAFFGSPAKFSTNAARLACVLGAPVVMFFGLYRGGNRYDIYFELLMEGGPVPKSLRDTVARKLTSQYACRLEAHAREAPYNWFNFYDFWADAVAAHPVRESSDSDRACARQ